MQIFTPLPPVFEIALSQPQKQDLQPLFQKIITGQSFKTVLLCRQAKALTVGDFILGAKNSRHSQSSLVLAERSEERIELAEIEYFIECVAIPDSVNDQLSAYVCPGFVAPSRSGSEISDLNS